MTVAGQATHFRMELKANSPVGLIRIHSGRGDGSSKVAACRVHGLNASGQVPELVSPEAGEHGTRNDDYVEYEFPPEVLTSLDFRLVAEDDTAGVFLREIGVYSPPTLPASLLNARFSKQVYGEFRLPVYEDQRTARLHLFNRRDDGNAHRVGVTLTERFTGEVIQPLRQLILPHGETQVPFEIRDLPDGSYIATVEDCSEKNVAGSRAWFQRLLRVQHSVPFEKQTRYDMAGKTMFFPDNHYLERSRNLRFRACSGRVVGQRRRTHAQHGRRRRRADLPQGRALLHRGRGRARRVLDSAHERRWLVQGQHTHRQRRIHQVRADRWRRPPAPGLLRRQHCAAPGRRLDGRARALWRTGGIAARTIPNPSQDAQRPALHAQFSGPDTVRRWQPGRDVAAG